MDGTQDGVSVYAPAVGLIRNIDRNEAQINGEFERGESRIIASSGLLRRDKDGRRQFDDHLFVGLDDDPETVGVTIFSPQLREESFLSRKQEYLRNVENVIGLKRGLLSEVEAAERTATEITSSAADYQTAIRRAVKNLTDKGIRVIDYESGVHTSVEAAVRRNVMSGLGLMQEQISQQNHDDFGCDGWEISAHSASAPDHEPIQGKQYSDADYQALNDSLVRRIGTLNCGHAAFPIILGVNSPQYTPEELEQLRQDNQKGVTVDGRHYSTYEATQMQRKLERAIRTQKRRILVDEATGDEDKLLTDRIKYQRLNQEYRRFSQEAGLRTQRERAEVAGFGSGQASRAVKANKSVERLANSMYDTGSTEKNVDAYMRDLPLRRTLQSGKGYPLQISIPDQNTHIVGTPEYQKRVETLKRRKEYGPSRLTVSLSDAQKLVNQYAGTGILERSRKSGEWTGKEIITVHPENIGVAVNNQTGAEAPTMVFKIHYSQKHGTHVVPDYPSKRGAKGRQ